MTTQLDEVDTRAVTTGPDRRGRRAVSRSGHTSRPLDVCVAGRRAGGQPVPAVLLVPDRIRRFGDPARPEQVMDPRRQLRAERDDCRLRPVGELLGGAVEQPVELIADRDQCRGVLHPRRLGVREAPLPRGGRAARLRRGDHGRAPGSLASYRCTSCFSEVGWTGQVGAVIVPMLVTAFGVFWMTQYLRQRSRMSSSRPRAWMVPA